MNDPVSFFKYVGAGNDFVIFDNWNGEFKLNAQQISELCHRRFGVGADGVMFLEGHATADFKMNYYNADGSRGEMCGNGARCLVRFAQLMGRIGTSGTFEADDGVHRFQVSNDVVDVEVIVRSELQDWEIPTTGCGFIDTGVPHLIIPEDTISTKTLDPLGWQMNEHEAHPQGTNVNIVENSSMPVKIRTWERGVNQETLSCGTGAVASAIFAHQKWGYDWPVRLLFAGGQLEVDYRGNQYWLKGPGELVFEGQLSPSMLHRN